MRALFLILLSLGVVMSARRGSKLDSVLTEWNEFKTSHNKRYSLDEDSARSVVPQIVVEWFLIFFLERLIRFQIWRKNSKFIEEHNAKADAGLVTFRTKMNRFGDLTVDEFFKFRNGLNASLKWSQSSKLVTFTESDLNKQVEQALNAQQVPSKVGNMSNLHHEIRSN